MIKNKNHHLQTRIKWSSLIRKDLFQSIEFVNFFYLSIPVGMASAVGRTGELINYDTPESIQKDKLITKKKEKKSTFKYMKDK